MAVPRRQNTAYPKAFGYDGAVGDIYVRLAAAPDRQLTYVTAPSEQRGLQTQENPEDFGRAVGQSFSRSAFYNGEGLDRAHRRDGTDRDWARYWDSYNIDTSPPTPGQAANIKLLHDTERVQEPDATGPQYLEVIDDEVFYSDGQDVVRVNTPTGTPGLTEEAPEAGGTPSTVEGLAVWEGELYAALGAEGVHTRSAAGTWSAFNALNPTTGLWAFKGRLLAESDDGLYEMPDGTTPTSSLVGWATGKGSCTSVTDAGPVLLAACSDGYIYSIGENDAGSALEVKGQTFIEGEIPVAVGVGAGQVFYTTRKLNSAGGYISRLYRAEVANVNSLFTLVNAQFLREWGDDTVTYDPTPHKIVATRDSVYMCSRDGDNVYAWRYFLATGGMSRWFTFSLTSPAAADGTTHGIGVVGDRLFVTITNHGFYRELTTYASEGWLVTPLIDFFIAEPKTWAEAGLDVTHANGTVNLYYSIDPDSINQPTGTGIWRPVAVNQSDGANTYAIASTESRFLAGKVVLASDITQTSTPLVRSLSFIAYGPNVGAVLDLPVNVSDQIERPGRKPLRIEGRGEAVFQALRELEGDSVLVELFRPELRLQGVVEQVAVPVDGITSRGSPTTYAIVRVRGRPVSATSTLLVDGEVLGIGKLGVTPMGA